VLVHVEPRFITEPMIRFIEENIKANPGRHTIKFHLYEPKEDWKIALYTLEKGFEMNDEMASFLLNNPELEVAVTSNL
jgi:DNA polymerase III subunit alpha